MCKPPYLDFQFRGIFCVHFSNVIALAEEKVIESCSHCIVSDLSLEKV